MNETEKNILRTNQVYLVNNLEASDILDYLLEDGVLTENDCELISNSKTRRERAQILLAMLPTRGPSAYGSFQRALSIGKYDFLQEKLSLLDKKENKDNYLRSDDENKKSHDLERCMEIISGCKNLTFQACLKQCIFLLIENVEPMDIIDHFFQEQLISADGLELVKIGKTRKDRCLIFIREIARCSSERAVYVLQISLMKKHSYISQFIKDTTEKKSSKEISKDKNTKTKSRPTTGKQIDVTETRVPTENSELCTETYQKIPSNSELSLTACKQTPKENEQTLSTRQLISPNVNEEETGLKRISEAVHENHPCEHETYSCSRCTVTSNSSSFPTKHTGESFGFNFENPLNSTFVKKLDTNNETFLKEFESVNRTSVPSSNVHDIKYPIMHHTDNDSSRDNVADSAACASKCQHFKYETVNVESKQQQKPVLLTLYSTDSESESISHKKQRRKHKNSRKNVDIDVSFGRDGARTAVNDETSKTIKSECQYSDTLTQTNGEISSELVVLDTEQNVVENQPSFTTSILSYQPGETNVNLPGRHLVVTFNYLSTLINQGNFDKFELFSSNLQRRYSKDPDMTCLLGYLHASRDLFRTDFDSAKKHIDKAFEIVPKTSNPKYFTLELFTSKTRMYISQKKLEKLQNALDDAKMIIETDPLGCTGRAAGWLYMNDARNCTAQIGLLNFRNPKAITSYTKLHKRAVASFQKALTNFQRDGGKDGPFGFGYALCRLAILLLRCGDNGRTMDILIPPDEDIKLASGYLQKLEDSEIAIPKILEMHFVLAKCDYQFRRGNTTRSLEYAEVAYDVASELKLLEFTEHAHNRCVFLRTKTPIVIDDVSEEEFTNILFGENSDIQTD